MSPWWLRPPGEESDEIPPTSDRELPAPEPSAESDSPPTIADLLEPARALAAEPTAQRERPALEAEPAEEIGRAHV